MKAMTYHAARVLLLFTVCSLLPLRGLAQATSGEFHLPEISSYVLPNGLRVLHASVNNVPTVDISFIVKAGAGTEPQGKQGVAQAVNQLLRNGTLNRDKGELDELLALLSTEVTTYTHYDYSQLYAKGLTRNFRNMLEVMSEMLTRPAFAEEQLTALRSAVPFAATEKTMTAQERASTTLLQQLCGQGSAVSTSLASRLQGIENLTVEDLRSFYARQYVPENTVVLVVGAVDASFVRTVATELLAAWSPDAVGGQHLAQSSLMEWTQDRVTIVSDTGAKLSQYRIGLPALPRSDERFTAQVVMNQLLGGSAEAVLFRRLWEEERLSPNVSSSIGYSSGCSYLVIAGSIHATKVASLLPRIKEACTSLQNGDFTEADVAKVTGTLRRQYAYEYSNNSGVLGMMKELALYARVGETFSSFLAELSACDRNAVMEVARETLRTDRMRVVMSGDPGVVGDVLGSDNIHVKD